MDYEKTTEDLIRRAMEEFQLQNEYQVFLDFLPHSLDFDNKSSASGKDEKLRGLIDSLMKV